MPSLNHIHQYIRWRKNLYRCAHPECTSYVDKTFLVGKKILCNECKQPFIATRIDLKRAKPKCLNCSDTAAAREYRHTSRAIEEMLSNLPDTPVLENGEVSHE